MADNEKTSEPAAPAAVEGTPPTPPRRSPGHRGADVKDTVAEMAAKAHEISLEAGSRMAAAMKDVVNAAAGLTDFVVESARDLVQFMVRRGQMTQDEADKLLDQVEASQPKRKAPPPPPPVKPNVTSAAPAMLRPVVNAPIPPKKTTSTAKSPSKPAKAAKPAVKAKTPPKKAAAKQAPPKKSASKPATKKVTAKKSAAKAPAKKSAKKPAAKKSAKASRK
ncbi:MAG: hypothetical protein ABIS03_05105 [Gemmatimonadaceae bacterium]